MSTAPDYEKIAEQAVADKQFDHDLRAVLSTREGRRLMWWIMTDSEAANIHALPLSFNSEVYFSNGRRFVGLMLRKAIELANKEALILMQKEAWDLETVNASGSMIVDGHVIDSYQ